MVDEFAVNNLAEHATLICFDLKAKYFAEYSRQSERIKNILYNIKLLTRYVSCLTWVL